MLSGVALSRTRASNAYAFGLLGLLTLAVALSAIALSALTSRAGAQPYPPSEPCAVSAIATAPTDHWQVVGSGLGAVQPVRVTLASSGATLATTRSDVNGTFHASVTAAADPDGSAPAINAISPQQTCGGDQPSASPTAPVRTPSGSGRTAPSGAPGGPAGGGPVASSPPSSAPPASGTTPGGRGSAGGTATSDAGATPSASTGPGSASAGAGGSLSPGPAASSSRADRRAEPDLVTQLPFGVGLAVAAALLVLGSLAVLVLARRPER